MNDEYLDFAKEACEQERVKNWSEARKLWDIALSKVSQSSLNYNWAKSRMQLCAYRCNNCRPLK